MVLFGEDVTVVKMKNLLSVLMSAVFMFALTQTASAQSSAADSQEVANNLVTQQSAGAASAQVAGLVGSAVSAAIAPPPPPGGIAPVTSYKGDGTQFFNSRQLGVAAGSAPKGLGVWVQGGYTSMDGDDTGGEFDGNVLNFLAGIDYKVGKKAVVGVAIGFEDLDIDTSFNNGTFEGTGYGITPYLGVAINDRWSVQLLAGWTTVEYDTTSNFGAITSSFDADRLYGAATVSGSFKVTNKIHLSPKASVLYLTEDQDGFTDSAGTVSAGSTIDLGRVSAGGTISYLAGKVTPFVRILGEYDFVKEDSVALGNGNFSSDDKAGLNATLGLNMNFANGWSGNVEGTAATLLRENLDVYTVSGRLRYQW
jgi:hypothetical protein